MEPPPLPRRPPPPPPRLSSTPPLPPSRVPNMADETLYHLLRRFNKQTTHIEAADIPSSRLDFSPSPHETFTPERLRSNVERVHLSMIKDLMEFGQQMVLLRSWVSPLRTGSFAFVRRRLVRTESSFGSTPRMRRPTSWRGNRPSVSHRSSSPCLPFSSSIPQPAASSSPLSLLRSCQRVPCQAPERRPSPHRRSQSSKRLMPQTLPRNLLNLHRCKRWIASRRWARCSTKRQGVRRSMKRIEQQQRRLMKLQQPRRRSRSIDWPSTACQSRR